MGSEKKRRLSIEYEHIMCIENEQQSKELEMKQEEYNKVFEQLERERQIQTAERERMNALLNGGDKAQSPRRKLIKAVSRSWSRLKRKKSLRPTRSDI